MSSLPAKDLVDGVENMEEVAAKKRRTDSEETADINDESGIEVEDVVKETSFDDLPDDILIKFFAYLDLPSRLRMRLNKRLDQIQLRVKNKRANIRVQINRDSCTLAVAISGRNYNAEFRDFNTLEKTLHRLSLNTSADRIDCKMRNAPSEAIGPVINALFHFEADHLEVDGWILPARRTDSPQVHISSPLVIANNMREVVICIDCNSLSAQDLSAIRKAMLEDNCKLKIFKMLITKAINKSFVKECFGVTIEEEEMETEEMFPLVKTYRTANESIELFSADVFDFSESLYHIEGDLQTSVDLGTLQFKRGEVWSEVPKGCEKVKLNHRYVKREWSW